MGEKTYSRWKEQEIDAIVENYPQHGRDWEGWDKLLPGRSPMAIAQKASKLGVYVVPHKAIRMCIENQPTKRGPWTPDMDRAAVSAIYLLARAVHRSATECAFRIIELEEARANAAANPDAREGGETMG